MTNEQYNKAFRLKQEASNLKGLINFINSSNIKCCIGREDPNDPEVIIPIENIYTLNSNIPSEYYSICLEVKEKLLGVIKDKLEEIEREFDYV